MCGAALPIASGEERFESGGISISLSRRMTDALRPTIPMLMIPVLAAL
jgi:hypothetical protein